MSSLLRTVFVYGQRSSTMLRATTRNISQSALRFDEKSPVPKSEEVAGSHILGARKHRPNNLEKRFLVWSGKFKTVGEVPDAVSQETMEKSRNKARIRIANVMILMTIVACVGVVINGKQAAKRGESVQQQNLDWHRQIKEEHQASKANK